MFERVILRATNGELKGREFVLENGRDYILGRATDCSCVLDDPFRLVSRHHCRIEVHAPFVRIQDLGSCNGTQVNGANIGRCQKRRLFEEWLQEGYTEYPLGDGDALQIAGYDFQVEFDPPPSCDPTELHDRAEIRSGDCVPC